MPPKLPATEDSFLSRWSRRKLSEAEEPAPVDEALPVDAEAAGQIGHNSGAQAAQKAEEPSDEEILEKLGLPDPDGLVAGDDFKAFMQSGVPQRFRNRALRRLWISNPMLANLDEMIDYGEDFTDAATVIENMQTVYEVGVGAARRVREELDAAARLAEQVAAEEALATPTEDGIAEAEEQESSVEPPSLPHDDTPPEEAVAVEMTPEPEPDADLTMRKARPMRFHFD